MKIIKQGDCGECRALSMAPYMVGSSEKEGGFKQRLKFQMMIVTGVIHLPKVHIHGISLFKKMKL